MHQRFPHHLTVLLLLLAAFVCVGIPQPVLAQGAACLACPPGVLCEISDLASCRCSEHRTSVGSLVGNRCRESGANCLFGIGCNYSPLAAVKSGDSLDRIFQDDRLVSSILWALGAEANLEPGPLKGAVALEDPAAHKLLFSYRYEGEGKLVTGASGRPLWYAEATFRNHDTGEETWAAAMVDREAKMGDLVVEWPDGKQQVQRWRISR